MIDLKHEIERELSLIDPPDLWDRIQVDASNNSDAAVQDLSTAGQRRRPSLWLAVAAVAALLVLVGALTLLNDDSSVDTVPATTEATESTTTETPEMRAFAVPFSLDGPFDDWTTVDGDVPFLDFNLGPADGLPQTSIKFAIPDAATPEDAVADITAKAPSLLVISDPVDTAVGDMPASCMDVEPPAGEPGGAPLFQIRDGSAVAYEVVLEEGAVGRVCVVDVEGRPVIVLVQAPTAEFAAFLEQAQAVLDAVEFDDRPTTLARARDVEVVEGVPQSGTLSRTLNIDAVEEDGEVTGEFRLNNVVVTLQCADTDTIDGEIRLGGKLTDDPDGRLVALIIREEGPDGDDRVYLYANDSAGSCTELVESVPYNLDGGYFDQVQEGYDIVTGGVIFNP